MRKLISDPGGPDFRPVRPYPWEAPVNVPKWDDLDDRSPTVEDYLRFRASDEGKSFGGSSIPPDMACESEPSSPFDFEQFDEDFLSTAYQPAQEYLQAGNERDFFSPPSHREGVVLPGSEVEPLPESYSDWQGNSAFSSKQVFTAESKLPCLGSLCASNTLRRLRREKLLKGPGRPRARCFIKHIRDRSRTDLSFLNLVKEYLKFNLFRFLGKYPAGLMKYAVHLGSGVFHIIRPVCTRVMHELLKSCLYIPSSISFAELGFLSRLGRLTELIPAVRRRSSGLFDQATNDICCLRTEMQVLTDW